MHTLTTHLVVRGPEKAAEWYKTVFGAAENSRITLPGGQIMTIELQFGDSTISIADEFPDMKIVSPLTLGGTYGAIHVTVPDADVVWKLALDNGASIFEPMHDAFWGDKTGQIIDPFGHRWAIDQHVCDVPHDEIERLAAEAFGSASQE